jgi:hypothetical protein
MVIAARQMGILNLLMDPSRRISLVAFAGSVLMMGGFLADWRWEPIGGILSFVGICLIYPATKAYGKITWFFAILFLPGLLHITSHILGIYTSGRSTTPPPTGSTV